MSAAGIAGQLRQKLTNRHAVGRPSLIANAVAIILSLAYYIFVLRARGVWILRDPVDDPNG